MCLLATLACVALLVAVSSTATAHTLVVAQPGDARIDLGDLSDLPRGGKLVHATLDAADDELVLTFMPAATATSIELLAPESKPEREQSIKQRPHLEAAQGLAEITRVNDARQEDDVTALTYAVFARSTIRTVPGVSSADPVELRITRGSAPSRVAVRVVPNAGADFVTDDAQDVPKSIALARGWFVTRPEHAPRTKVRAERNLNQYVWVPALIALTMLGCMVWWVRRGRTQSRVRGIERADEQQD